MSFSTFEEVIAAYGLPVRAVRGQYRGPCPIHRGANPTAFVITPARGFYCHACGVGGGIDQLVAHLEGRSAPRGSRRAREGKPPTQPTKTRLLQPLDADHPYFRGRGIHPATARSFGAGYFHGAGVFGGRIVFPVHDASGILAGHIGRSVDDAEPRYRVEQGLERASVLFNLHRVPRRATRSVIVCEGPFDALAVHQVGYPNVVALLGCRASAWQMSALATFDRVFVLLDADSAGLQASKELVAFLGDRASRLILPPPDPCTVKGVILDALLRPTRSHSSVLAPQPPERSGDTLVAS